MMKCRCLYVFLAALCFSSQLVWAVSSPTAVAPQASVGAVPAAEIGRVSHQIVVPKPISITGASMASAPLYTVSGSRALSSSIASGSAGSIFSSGAVGTFSAVSALQMMTRVNTNTSIVRYQFSSADSYLAGNSLVNKRYVPPPPIRPGVRIPVGEGTWWLLLLAVSYAGWRVRRRARSRAQAI